MLKNLLNGLPVFHTSDDMHGRINAAGAGTRRSGDLDWPYAFLADLNIDMDYRDVDQGREQERKL